MSSFTKSMNLLFGLPLGLLSGSMNLNILLPTQSLSLLWTCPNHLNLASLAWSPKHLTWALPLCMSCPSSLLKRTSTSSALLPPALSHFCTAQTKNSTREKFTLNIYFLTVANIRWYCWKACLFPSLIRAAFVKNIYLQGEQQKWGWTLRSKHFVNFCPLPPPKNHD